MSIRSFSRLAVAALCLAIVACSSRLRGPAAPPALVGAAYPYAYPIGTVGAGSALTGSYPAPGVNLSASAVSGTLPVADLAPGPDGGVLTVDGGVVTWGTSTVPNLFGDVTGSITANSVSAINGSSPLPISTPTLRWTATTAFPTLTQATATSDIAAQALTLSPQAPYAFASTHTSSGPLVLNLPETLASPRVSGSAISYQYGGSEYANFGLGQTALTGQVTLSLDATTLANAIVGLAFVGSSGQVVSFNIGTITNQADSVQWNSFAKTNYRTDTVAAAFAQSYGAGATSVSESQTAAASTSAGSGAAGATWSRAGQAGQAATGASHAGGAGASVTFTGGAGGNSGSAAAGAGGPVNLTGGAAGTGSTGAVGGAVNITGGASSSGNAGGPVTITTGTGSGANGGPFTIQVAGGGPYIQATSAGTLSIGPGSGSNELLFTLGALELDQPTLIWGSGIGAVNFSQSGVTTASTLGSSTTIAAQASTGSGSTGGSLYLNGGNGPSAASNGSVWIGGGQAGATPKGFTFASLTVTLGATGTTTLTSAQQAAPFLIMSTVTLAGGVTLALNGVTGTFFIDFSNVTLGVNAVTITNGAGSFTATTLLGVKKLLIVNCASASTITVGANDAPANDNTAPPAKAA